MAWQTVAVERVGTTAVVSLNRPEKRNAMNPRMHEEMTDLLEQLRDDDDVRVLVLTGAGDAFCAGMDVKEFFVDLKGNPKQYERIERLANEWRGRTLRYYPKPTIAMVNGWCFGGGLSNVEVCDLALAAEEATFGLSEINFRMFPGGTVSKSIANLLRPRDALYYALTGFSFDGREAERIGLVNRAVPLARLREETLALADHLATKDAVALRMTKDAYRHSLDMGWEAAMNYSNAKHYEIIQLQKDLWRGAALPEFLEGKYRPGLEGHAGKGG